MSKSVVFSLLLFVCFSVCANCQWLEEDPTLGESELILENGRESVFLTTDSDENMVILRVTNPTVPENTDCKTNLENTLNNEISPSQTSDNPLILTIEVLAEKVQRLISNVNDQESKIKEMETSYKTLEEKLDLIEQQTKTNNVIFFNVKEDKHENHKVTLQKVLSIINRQMKVRVNVKDISVALRADGNDTQIRPIIVRFANFDTKMKVLAVRNRLTHSKIMVVGDYSEQVAKKRIALLPYMESARSNGDQAFILYDKLVINGVKKTLEELEAEGARKQQSEDTTESREQAKPSEDDPKEQVEEMEEPVGDYEDFE